jgi:hypothetical protein
MVQPLQTAILSHQEKKHLIWWSPVLKIALSKGSISLGVFLYPKTEAQPGFRNAVLHLKLYNGKSSKQEDHFPLDAHFLFRSGCVVFRK